MRTIWILLLLLPCFGSTLLASADQVVMDWPQSEGKMLLRLEGCEWLFCEWSKDKEYVRFVHRLNEWDYHCVYVKHGVLCDKRLELKISGGPGPIIIKGKKGKAHVTTYTLKKSGQKYVHWLDGAYPCGNDFAPSLKMNGSLCIILNEREYLPILPQYYNDNLCFGDISNEKERKYKFYGFDVERSKAEDDLMQTYLPGFRCGISAFGLPYAFDYFDYRDKRMRLTRAIPLGMSGFQIQYMDSGYFLSLSPVTSSVQVNGEAYPWLQINFGLMSSLPKGTSDVVSFRVYNTVCQMGNAYHITLMVKQLDDQHENVPHIVGRWAVLKEDLAVDAQPVMRLMKDNPEVRYPLAPNLEMSVKMSFGDNDNIIYIYNNKDKEGYMTTLSARLHGREAKGICLSNKHDTSPVFGVPEECWPQDVMQSRSISYHRHSQHLCAVHLARYLTLPPILLTYRVNGDGRLDLWARLWEKKTKLLMQVDMPVCCLGDEGAVITGGFEDLMEQRALCFHFAKDTALYLLWCDQTSRLCAFLKTREYLQNLCVFIPSLERNSIVCEPLTTLRLYNAICTKNDLAFHTQAGECVVTRKVVSYVGRNEWEGDSKIIWPTPLDAPPTSPNEMHRSRPNKLLWVMKNNRCGSQWGSEMLFDKNCLVSYIHCVGSPREALQMKACGIVRWKASVGALVLYDVPKTQFQIARAHIERGEPLSALPELLNISAVVCCAPVPVEPEFQTVSAESAVFRAGHMMLYIGLMPPEGLVCASAADNPIPLHIAIAACA